MHRFSLFSPFAELFKRQRLKEKDSDQLLRQIVIFLDCLPHRPKERYYYRPNHSKTDLQHEHIVHPVCQKLKKIHFIHTYVALTSCTNYFKVKSSFIRNFSCGLKFRMDVHVHVHVHVPVPLVSMKDSYSKNHYRQLFLQPR